MLNDDVFVRLVEAVEADGGELCAETHFPTLLAYENDKGQDVPVESTGCGLDMLLLVPYEDHQPNKDGVEADTVVPRSLKVCALDDRVDLWPRFATRAHEGSA